MLRKLLSALGIASVLAPETQAQITPRPEVLTGAFEAGFIGEADKARYPLRVVRIGEVEIASGRVMLVDPFLMSTQDRPLALVVPPGRYPVDLAVADAGEGGHRVALARLLISDAAPVRWEMATTDDQDLGTLSGDAMFGYAVDAGTGAFIDAGAPAWLAERYADAETYAAVLDDWQTRGEAAAEKLGLPHGFALVEDLGPGGAAMFASGWGDGVYASWVGYDAEGRPAAVVTDFAVITAVNIPPAPDSR